ncbi:alpha-hydroxy-acid oxidizing protein, partial [Bacillus thuringiensis]|nr:alpha-hydroxy-acid oxidizing protein [Bacillus thuringiensis]
AKRRTPAAAFDYTDGAAEGEISLARARQAFKDVEFHPGVLSDVSHVDTSTTVLGGPSALPFGIGLVADRLAALLLVVSSIVTLSVYL